MASKVRLYLGNLPVGIQAEEVEKVFSAFGTIKECTLKERFGFIEFNESPDAVNAEQKSNVDEGIQIQGQRLVVQFARERVYTHSASRDRSGGSSYGGGGGGYGSRGPPSSASSYPPSGGYDSRPSYGRDDRYDRDRPSDRGGDFGGREVMRCFRCGDEGHISRDCKNSDRSMSCYRCGSKDHRERQCDMAPPAGGAAPYAPSRSSAPYAARDRSRSISPRRRRAESPPPPRKRYSRSRSRSPERRRY